MKTLRVGLLGFGHVGRAVWDVLKNNIEEISRRADQEIKITHIAVRNLEKAKKIVGNQAVLTNDINEIIHNHSVDIILELIGGSTIALDAIKQAISLKKHVVTANKALIAEHGNLIFNEAEKQGVMIGFEAAVAGGIPIIKTIKESMSANKIEWLAGIINGTSNYILSEMYSKGIGFDEALRAAQELGYAEADPTFDINGTDAAHKLVILSGIAFGIPIQLHKAHIEGITNIQKIDIEYARKFNYQIKLVGITRRSHEGIELRVHPTLIPDECLLSHVNGAMNAIFVKADALGKSLYYGQGAGGKPTASAVIADLVDVARMHSADPTHHVPHMAFQLDCLSNLPILELGNVESSYYLRIKVKDEPGVLAAITQILADKHISIDAILQIPVHTHQEEDQNNNMNHADIVILTHRAKESWVSNALKEIQDLPEICQDPIQFRIEDFK